MTLNLPLQPKIELKNVSLTFLVDQQRTTKLCQRHIDRTSIVTYNHTPYIRTDRKNRDENEVMKEYENEKAFKGNARNSRTTASSIIYEP